MYQYSYSSDMYLAITDTCPTNCEKDPQSSLDKALKVRGGRDTIWLQSQDKFYKEAAFELVFWGVRLRDTWRKVIPG